MTGRRAETALQLEEILEELRSIAERALELESGSGEPIDLDRLSSEVSGTLELQFDHYISFLDELECLAYDPGDDQVELLDAIDEPIEAPPSWIDEVEFEFADVIVDSAYGPGESSGPNRAEADDEQTFEAESSIVEEVNVKEPEESGPPTPPDPPPATEPPNDDVASDAEESPTPSTTGGPPVAASSSEPETPSSSPADPQQTKETDREASNDSSDDTSSMNDRKRRTSRSERKSRTSTTSDRYERVDEIGTGGLGTVYEGRHKPLDRRVAIKEISNVFDVFADIQRGDIVDRFRDITQAQARISHPSITQVYDLDTNREYPIVVTEYAPNGSLRRLIDDDENRTLRVALKYFIQILHGLNAAHSDGLIHGNIKPENVLLDVAGNAKLSDFGLSTLVDLEGASDQVYVGVGAVAYMAPEQFQNPNAATTESDIYSLGIMFYEMLTGKVPGRRSPMPSSFYPDIPRKLDDIFDRMSMDAAEDRYSSIEEILRDFYGAEEIISLLDRQSGVVFLRDPLKYGDEPLADADGEIQPPEEADPLEPADALQSGEFPEESEAETLEEPSEEEQSETPEESEAVGDDETEAESSDDAGEEEGTSDDEVEAENEEGQEDEDEPRESEEGEDDEVLDKLDEYGEMFDE